MKLLPFAIGSLVLLFIIEQIFSVSYVVNTVLKLVCFVGIPLLIAREKMLARLRAKRRYIVVAFLAGAFFFAILLGTYMILAPFIDLSTIAHELSKLQITPANFIAVGLYIIFINSFVEEFFFRGALFEDLRAHHPILAYAGTSLLFSAYHIGIFLTWFSLPVFLLCLFGLAAVGALFCWLDRHGSILPSWIAHACADIAIILIGLMMFGMV